MDAPKGVHMKALAGNIEAASNMDVILESSIGLVRKTLFTLLNVCYAPTSGLFFLLITKGIYTMCFSTNMLLHASIISHSHT